MQLMYQAHQCVFCRSPVSSKFKLRLSPDELALNILNSVAVLRLTLPPV